MTETEKLIRELRDEIEDLRDEIENLTKGERIIVYFADGYLHVTHGEQHYRVKGEKLVKETCLHWERE